MAGSLLPLGKRDLIEFQYTPIYGNAPVYFKVKFYSGYVGEFTGKIYNTIVLFVNSGDPDFGKIKWVHYEQDTKGRDTELRCFRDIDGREVDFVITAVNFPDLLDTFSPCFRRDTGWVIV